MGEKPPVHREIFSAGGTCMTSTEIQSVDQTAGKRKSVSKEASFVNFIFQKVSQDKGVAARLRRADNPATEYQSWEVIAPWVDLDNPYERIPYAVIAAAIARTKAEKNGRLGMGRALSLAFEHKGSENHTSQANARLRRLLAANDLFEVCRLMR